MTARVSEVAAVAAVALILTIALAAPVLQAPTERIFGTEIVGRHYDPFIVMQQFDRPIARTAYLQPLTDVPGAWFARATGPVAAYNWLVLLSFPLSAMAAYLLARYVALSPASATIAAITFAFSPFHLAHAAYHPHIAQIQWLPLYLFALWRCLDRATPASIGLLAVSVVAVTLSNFYGGLIAAVMTPVAMAAYWFFKSRSEPGSSRRLAITLASLIVIAGAGLGYAWYAAHGVVTNRAAFAFPRDALFPHSAKWWSYLVPPLEHPVLGGMAQRVWTAAGVQTGLLEQQVSLGWAALALSLVALCAWCIRRRHNPSLAIVPALATIAVVAVVCSLSPEATIGEFTFLRPSAFLYPIVPMFRAYARFAVVVQLMVALLAAIGAEYLWRSGRPRARMACVVLLTLVAGEYAVQPMGVWRDVLPTAAHRWVVRQPDAVRVLDCAPLTPESESIEWLTGYRVSLRARLLNDCRDPNLGEKLSAAGYTHLLLRGGTAEGRWFEAQDTPKGLELTMRFGDGDVFAVTSRRPPAKSSPSITAAACSACSP